MLSFSSTPYSESCLPLSLTVCLLALLLPAPHTPYSRYQQLLLPLSPKSSLRPSSLQHLDLDIAPGFPRGGRAICRRLIARVGLLLLLRETAVKISKEDTHLSEDK